MNSIEAVRPEFNDIIAPDTTIETIAEGLVFTEGPVWDARHKRLLFSDIPADTNYSWSQTEGLKPFRHPAGFPNGMTFNRQGDLITCEHQTRAVTVTKEGGKPQVVASHFNGKKLNSPNDIVAANDGSILFTDPIYGLREGNGGPAEAELDFQGVYRLPPGGGELELVTDSFERPNGLALSRDEKQLYIIDTVRQHIRVFQVGENWEISGGCIWVELWDDGKVGRPDGMKFDKQGNLFSTGPGGVWVFNPQGDVLGRIYLPDKTSNLAWGDDDLQSLFIASSTKVYRVRCQTGGWPLVD
jgi:gluconolactonase